MSISDKIRQRIVDAGKPFHANDTIYEFIEGNELNELQVEIEAKAQALLDALIIDTESDHNTKETAKRIAKLYLREVFAGRYSAPPTITDFPNHRKLDEVYTLGPIAVRSSCSHHFCPITGNLWVGVIPSERVIGISKFARIARWVLGRPQIQEEAVIQLADYLEAMIKPRGLAIVIKAEHTCMTWRGVSEHKTSMTTNVMRGIFRDGPAARAEFFEAIKGQGFQFQCS